MNTLTLRLKALFLKAKPYIPLALAWWKSRKNKK
ncbi:hypothetical protein SEA_TRIBUTE_175 [Streptomyces phage Tribute]|uniref:Uncharacterized protein n=5 Tax=Samistivirus TaxID=2560220 RepID=A0A5Q2WL74_9CAUD|nr:hypothetical protein FDI38_gp124 [Streptomyces phage Peebs]YP_010101561.1 hypothetical protein KNU49_gp127 [Streptomyces phage EGole]ASR76571.1 hypothetical protein SEA_SUSHI23_178 [Streptomyces phage Sushi23]QGH78331.1 hypothetical protein SEA_TRIBUTE_175 [Streptomyces phage Tribute]QRI46133.1 hypothetical protein SEA_CROSS_177 [Streptomyces phage Cross]WDS51937.1 hypothetical protein SEA_PEPPERWOOD_176 [Streptomyces phage Pepperwood]WNN95502.1 hypothetical protein SEA_WATERMOORE_176 [Str